MNVRSLLLAFAILLSSVRPAAALHGPGDDTFFEDGFDCRNWYADTDMDGFGDPDVFELTCTPQANYVYNANDCDDGNANVKPGADDLPDALFVDADCDGFDGELDRAIFVSAQPNAANTATCGTLADPCATILHAAQQRVPFEPGKRDVYVAGGFYEQQLIVVSNGINVFGGFGTNGQRAPALAEGSRVTTVSGTPSIGGLFPTPVPVNVVIFSITTPTTIADLTLIGFDSVFAGGSSYGIVAQNVTAGALTITRNTIVPGNGAAGPAGGNGSNAPGSNDGVGADGVPGDEASLKQGGNGGTNSACGTGTAGGDGGDGGDTGGQFGGSATGGMNGVDGGQAGGVVGAGGTGGAPSASGQAQSGQPGSDGRITNGASGLRGAAGGRLAGTTWAGRNGEPGGLGENGGGGGGGGGGGASDANVDDYGSSGAGGGAGGCAAGVAANGGTGGGGSFGIYLINASPVISNNTIMRGTGGSGGAGGAGGAGQPGADGGDASPAVESGGGGGAGGRGGHGGHGGGGGGGAGGDSVGIYATSAASAPTLDNNTISGGSGGAGGAGGTSAPSVTGDDDDGNDGETGAAGTVRDTGVCAAPAAC